jgi:hypothetical protein
MKILVTGGAGFIGSALVRHLIGHTDHEVLVVDKLTYAGLSVKWLTHFSRFAPLKVRCWSQEGTMAPKPKSKPARFVFAVAMALTILAVMMWEMAVKTHGRSPHSPILRPYPSCAVAPPRCAVRLKIADKIFSTRRSLI